MPVGSSDQQRTLGVVSYMPAYRHLDRVYIHVATGRVVDALAPDYATVYLCAPTRDAPPAASTDVGISARNLVVIPQPFFLSSLEALRHVVGIARAYYHVCRHGDDLFVRGIGPYNIVLMLLAWVFGRRVCQWLIGDPIALLKSHRRSSRLIDLASLAYAYQDYHVSRCLRWLTDGAFVCSGDVVAAAYRSPRTVATVSSSLGRDEFFEREDTCLRDPVRILYLGFIRPEKGIEYLIQAVTRLKTHRRWQLTLVGSPQQFGEYAERCRQIATHAGLSDCLVWKGYVSYGQPLLRCLRDADILVLPSLSEGTPHVLLEARAQGVPVIATRVGGIPSSVQHEVNGLLVPPRDADALAQAIDRVIADGGLRRRLIRNGLAFARTHTVDDFAALIRRTFQSMKTPPGRVTVADASVGGTQR